MAAVPIYVWNGTAWQETGPVIPASPIKYQASAPSSPSTGDIWVDSDGDVTTGSQQFQRFRFVASGGETTISGVDANGATLAYTAGTEIVALNGSTLVRGSDYTATNGTSITGLSPALVSGDVLEVFSFMAFNVANTYTQSQVDGLVNAVVGQTLLSTTTLTGSSVTISDISQAYKDLKIVVRNFLPATDNTQLRIQLNADSTANRHTYVSSQSASNTSFTTTFWNVGDGQDSGTSQALTVITISDYTNTTTWKQGVCQSIVNNSTTTTNVNIYNAYGVYNQTSAITSLALFPASGNFTSGTCLVYGVK